ncbi:MAG: hypothetical protein WCF90_09145, partial [Methanomicrobiales archaeon]
NFVESMSANGQMRVVNSTGDQFYQFPIVNGMIEGYVEKQDGSVKNLIIRVCDDGGRVSQCYTSAPVRHCGDTYDGLGRDGTHFT